jgi:hypothetical protein
MFRPLLHETIHLVWADPTPNRRCSENRQFQNASSRLTLVLCPAIT